MAGLRLRSQVNDPTCGQEGNHMFKNLKTLAMTGAMAFTFGASTAPAGATQVSGKEQTQMQKAIQGKLKKDGDLKNNRIAVSVETSVATLKGTVDTASEKAKAEELAHVDGIVRVDNELEVGSKNMGAAITDTALTAKLKAELVADDQLKHSDISVTTNNGVVILTGTVPTQAESDHATAVVQNADGVKTVSNKLRVTGAAH
jgi:hyperosmotically inducible protein